MEASDQITRYPDPLADLPHLPSSGNHIDYEGVPDERASTTMRETSVPYEAFSFLDLWILARQIFTSWGEGNDLTFRQRLKWIGALAVVVVILSGGLVAIAWGVVRMVNQLLRTF